MKNILVMYHASCNDGIASAWVAYKKFGDNAEYLPWQYGDTIPEMANRKVFLLDLSLPKDKIEAVKDTVEYLVIVDHHKSSFDELGTLYTEIKSFEELTSNSNHCKVFTWFDMNYSGAVLTWQFFNSNSTSSHVFPSVLNLINDYDLWKHELQNTKEFNAWLASGKLSIDRFESALLPCGSVNPHIFEIGKSIMEYDLKVAIEIARSYVRDLNWKGNKVATVNAPTHLRNEVADLLSSEYDMVVCYTVRKDKVVYSLRSSGKVDVCEIAKRFGSGGHSKAASFSIVINNTQLPELSWLFD